MAIGEFGGAPAALATSGPMYAGAGILVLRNESGGAQSFACLRRRRTPVLSQSLPIRCPTPPSASPWPRAWNCSSARRGAMASRSGISTPPWSAASMCRCTSRPYGSDRSVGSCISSAPSSTRRAGRSRACSSWRRCRGIIATLLRGTVEGFLPNHDVYITEWVDARMVPVSEGSFDLDDYIDYLISILHVLGGDVHVLAVCQPSVPVLAAVARMEADDDPYVPAFHGADGRPDRYARQSDRGEQARGAARHRLVPPQRHHQGAVSQSGFHARRLSGLSAAPRLRQHESRSAYRGAPQTVLSISSKATAIPRRSTANSTTNISPSWISARRVLSADGRHRVRASRAAEGRDDASRRPRRSGADPPRRRC